MIKVSFEHFILFKVFSALFREMCVGLAPLSMTVPQPFIGNKSNCMMWVGIWCFCICKKFNRCPKISFITLQMMKFLNIMQLDYGKRSWNRVCLFSSSCILKKGVKEYVESVMFFFLNCETKVYRLWYVLWYAFFINIFVYSFGRS